MPRPSTSESAPVAALRAALLALNDLCPGSLVQRWTQCGRATCPCATDPKARHGPYWVWSRLEGRRLVQTRLTPRQATRMRRAIRNERRAQALLARWGRATARAILAERNTG